VARFSLLPTCGMVSAMSDLQSTCRMSSPASKEIDCPMPESIRIIGIDPGLRNTGWGIVESQGSQLRFIAAGTVRSNAKSDLSQRLCQLHDGLSAVLDSHGPDEAAVENTFVNKDAGATLKLGQARGIALLVPARAGLLVAEYAPNAVKKAVIGVGHGDKNQIKLMVGMLLPKATYDSDDAADGLAIAICHAHHRGGAGSRLAAAAERSGW